MQTSSFDELDLRLLHGLQIAPRVSWAECARILGVTPMTLVGRWERIRSRGLAWIVAHPSATDGGVMTAFVEVECETGRHREVLETLARDPRVMTIEQTARGRGDLLLTVMTPDMASLSRYLLDDLPLFPGIRAQRGTLALEIHRQGRDWRLHALDRRQQADFEAAATPTSGEGDLPRQPWPIIEALARDGRSSAADIARATGRNPATVRRQLARVLGSGSLAVRCEIAMDPTLWGLHCTWLARVPEVERERTVAALSTLPELRLLVSISGPANLLISVWAKSPTDLMRVERLIGERLPWLAVDESIVVLRTAKRMGWMIDEAGRATGEVVLPAVLGGEGRSPSS